MSAYSFIRERRRSEEKIAMAELINLATCGDKNVIEKQMEKWARDADISITFGD